MTDVPSLVIKITPTIADVDAAAWDACATGTTPGKPTNPFVSHAFLLALEVSGSVGGATGWNPAHVLVEDEAGALLACAPAYLKTHSQGEYVFDHGWADAFERAGGQYYPKVQVSAPFSPVTGPRLLVRADVPAALGRDALLQGLRALRKKAGASSIHLTFLPREDWAALGEQGLLQRLDQQFHWENAGYENFDGFLASLASRKRKMIRKEREAALANGITIESLTGTALTPAHWDAFYAFYMDTSTRKWGRPYLARRFFDEISRSMADKVLLVIAARHGRPIAGAINFIGHDTLYGRNWGCIEDQPFLHFEVCYYRAIDYAITHGLARVEAGAQGEHKLARGYLPSTTYSAHDIADPGFRRAVDDYLRRERQQVVAMSEALTEESPYRKADGNKKST
jgi:uncharacterized protein